MARQRSIKGLANTGFVGYKNKKAHLFVCVL